MHFTFTSQCTNLRPCQVCKLANHLQTIKPDHETCFPFAHALAHVHSERSEVSTGVLVTLAWFPEFRKSRSRPLEHHRPAFAVYQLLIRLLTCYRVSQSRAMLRLAQVYVPHLKNCAPPLKLALHCHSSDPNFITTHRLADNRPTL